MTHPPTHSGWSIPLFAEYHEDFPSLGYNDWGQVERGTYI